MTSHIAWLDLETDAADDYRLGHILEIGVVVTDMELNILKSFQRVLGVHERVLRRMPEKVREMHKSTYLWDECLESTDDIFRTDFALQDFLKQFSDEPLALAGSGVLHYDKKWIMHHLPRSRHSFTYWGYDVGVVRRVLRDLAGMPLPNTERNLSGVKHRALDDAVSAVLEMRLYLSQLKTLPGWGSNERP